MKLLAKKRGIIIIFLAVVALVIILEAYNLISFFTKGHLEIISQMSKTYYSGQDMNVAIQVRDMDEKYLNSKVKLQLYDGNDKKVKDAKTTIELEGNQKEAVTLKLPDDVQTGQYNLKITATSGIYKDTDEIAVNIIKDNLKTVNISLDKGIYKPGDEVNYRALILSNKNYTPEKENVNIEIYDGNENKVYSENVETSEYGIISGKFLLGDEVNSGTYRITVKTDAQEINKTFTVNPYITPQFEASITTDKESYIVGETAQITIASNYFFGEPVKSAEVKGKIGDKDIVGITDSNGNFNTIYEVTEAGSLNLDFEVIDSSNYAVEANKQLVCGTDIFEIEVLPEYGKIVKGIQNDIYVITKTAAGEPVKTYSTIRIGNISKQVISDDNGIGMFTLTDSETEQTVFNTRSSSSYSYRIDYIEPQEVEQQELIISSEDMNSNSVVKNIDVEIEKDKGIYIKTDKIKYEANDDINVSLESNADSNNCLIYVFKNNELLNIYSSDSNEFKFNLEDTTGLIDIYAMSKFEEDYIENYSKKTIFIKPNKTLNISVETDKEEYKPGESLNIKFNTTDNKGQPVESALLVSILDEAVLQLADNDLSIDNIKLALQDVELTSNVTAADLYAEVLDESSDVILSSLLLKQSSKDINIVSHSYINDEAEEYLLKAIGLGVISIIIVAIYCFIRFKESKKLIITILNLLFMFGILFLFIGEILYEYIDSSFIVMFTIAVISTIIYSLCLNKQQDYIFRMLKNIIIIPLCVFIIITIIENNIEYGYTYIFSDIIDLMAIILCVIAIFIYAKIIKKAEKQKLSDFEKILKMIIESLLEGFFFWLATIIIIRFFESRYAFLITLIGYVFFTKFVFSKNKLKIIDRKLVLDFSNMDILGVITGIVFMLIIILIYITFESAQSVVNDGYAGSSDIYDYEDELYFESSDSSRNSNSGGVRAADIKPGGIMQSATDVTGSAGGQGDVFENLGDLMPFGSDLKGEQIIESTTSESEIPNVEVEVETDNNIRNVFLESLAFIPEIVTESGTAETTISISDNITTWNIQTVGNTKNGEIGSATAEFKVFKEFFVDFSLPQNSVVTDKISIPVTLYNYTETDSSINLEVKTNEWCNIGDYTKNVTVAANSTSMIYVPIEILKDGNNTLRVEATSGNLTDIVEKTFAVDINGFEKQEIALSGSIKEDYAQDMIFSESAIENTKKIRVKLYPNHIIQAVEGMESMLKLPSGCFEQTSSSLYPDVLILKYLENNDLNNSGIKEKALNYIEKGYQKLLTFEVKNEQGGYSLYGESPAEPVITAFGLMEMKEISEVYNVDENVLEEMKEYLFKKQKTNGSFDDINSVYIGGASKTDEIAMNAYITWALSEVYPDDSRLTKSVKYLENKLDTVTDSYTLALIANVFANTDNSATKDVIKRLNEQIKANDNSAYIESDISDYYGSRGKYQNVQTTALFSMALSKTNSNNKTNEQLIEYLLQAKKPTRAWGTTQSTILALKALNEYSNDGSISNQKLTVNVNGEEQTVEVKEDVLDFYELEFTNIEKENKIEIGMEKGKVTYEIIKEYYIPYSEELNKTTPKILVEQTITQTAKVNDIITQNIIVANNSDSSIENELVQINIPQGCSVDEESLALLKHEGKIEKYEYNYGKINLYIRGVEKKEQVELQVQYRALYPETITGGSIIAYDYYNPEIQGITAPVQITVTE